MLMGEDVTACELSTMTITATTDVTAPVQWYADEDLTMLLGEGDTYELVLMDGANTIYATAGEGTGCADTASITVDAEIFMPGIESDTTIFVCAGYPTSINPNGNPNYDYEWIPSDNLDLTIPWNPSITTFENDTIQMLVMDPSTGCSFEAEIIVIPVTDPNLIVVPSDTAVCFVGEFELSATTDVPAPITWFTDDFNTFLGEGNIITVDLAEGENIICAIAGAGTGCADTVCVTIQATDFQPGLENTLLNICANTDTPINPNGNPDYEYQWDPTDNLDLSDPWNPIVLTDTDQTYGVTVTDPISGCSLETEIMVSVITPIIELESDGDTTLCEQVPIILTASASGDGVNLVWYDNIDLDTDPIGEGTEITVTPSVGQTTYVVQATDVNGCQDTSWVHVEVILVEPNLTSPIVTCEGEDTPLNPNGNPNLMYAWEPAELVSDPMAVNPVTSLSESTTFTVTVSDSTGFCVIEEMVEVQVLGTIGLIAGTDTTLCQIGAEAILEAEGSNENVNYIWYYNDPSSNEPDTIGFESQVIVTPDETTTYYVMASYNGLCSELDSVVVIVAPIMAIVTPDFVICEPINLFELEVTNLDPSQMLTYQWDENVVASDPSQASVMAIVEDFTDFSVTVTNEEGCEEVLSTTVITIDLENTLTITADPDEILEGQSSVLEVLGCDNCTYLWEGPGDISDPTDQSTTVTPIEPGEATYSVTVTDRGCVEVLTITLTVRSFGCDERHVFLPDAFTPNGDGVNDVLYLRSNSIVDMYLVIYNRWGQRLFETNDQSVGWDGTFQKEELPPDVYGYYLEYTCIGETESRKYRGNVTILK